METRNKKSIVFARYLWLYGEIAGKGPVSFETISKDWMRSSLNENCNPLPHKTFENHRNAIQEMFGISIECDRDKSISLTRKISRKHLNQLRAILSPAD